MKFPRLILIRDVLWQVRFKKKIMVGQMDVLGLADPSQDTVFINSKMNFEEKLTTLVHELLHCIEEEYGFEIGESLIRKLEEPIAKILLDNFL